MNTPAYLGLSILEPSKAVIYEFWYDCVKPKYGEKAKLCYLDTDSFFEYIKTDDIYKSIVEDVKIRFHTSSYELEKPLPKGKNKEAIDLIKDELGEKTMTKFIRLKAKTYSYLIDYGSGNKKLNVEKFCKKRNKKKKLNLKIIKTV